MRLTAVSLNACYPEFGSVRRAVAAGKLWPWDRRVGVLADAIKAQKPDLVLVQECGQPYAGDLFAALGKVYHYQRFGPLNLSGWRSDRIGFLAGADLDLPDYGQWPGRGVCGVVLDCDGVEIVADSGHLPVRGSNPTISAAKARLARADHTERWARARAKRRRVVAGFDLNSRATDLGNTPRRIAKRAGYTAHGSGIDAFLTRGVTVTESARFRLGRGSDHTYGRRITVQL